MKAAIRWLRAHAAQYGLDGQRFGLWGSSAGAHLGAIVALAGSGALEAENIAFADQPVAVQAVVDGYGPTDFLGPWSRMRPIVTQTSCWSGIRARCPCYYGRSDDRRHFLQMDAHRKPIPPEAEDPESIQVPPEKRTADADSFESILIGALVEDRPDLVRAASPLAYVRGDAPPFLIIYGLSDGARACPPKRAAL